MDKKCLGKAIISCYPYLEGVYKTLDNCAKEIVNKGYNYSSNVFDLYEKVARYIDRRNGIVNLKVLSDKSIKVLPKKFKNVLILHYVEGFSYDEIMKRERIKERALFYRFEKAYEMLMDNAALLGYTEDRIVKEYRSEPFFQNMLKRVSEKESI